MDMIEEKGSDTVIAGSPDSNSDSNPVHNTRCTNIRAVAAQSQGSERIVALGQLSAEAGGFLDDKLRRLVWPLALRYSTPPSASTDSVAGSGCHDRSSDTLHPAWASLPVHKDEEQVRLDVNRAFVYYPDGLSSERAHRLKDDLFEVIVSTLRRCPKLCYFQGFHDIAQVVLLVLGKELAFDAVPILALTRLRDFMLPSLSTSIAHLELLPAVLKAADRELAAHVSNTRPFFALAATLTLFSHDVESYSEIARLFDYLLTNEAVSAVYLFASIVLDRREELLEVPEEEPEMLHFKLSKLPKPLDLDHTIAAASELIQRIPPERLPGRAWRKISSYSVLKTTRHGEQVSSEEATKLLDAQLTEMAAAERMTKRLAIIWSWRRPAAGVGAAIIIGVLAVWLQRHHPSTDMAFSNTWSLMWKQSAQLHRLLRWT